MRRRTYALACIATLLSFPAMAQDTTTTPSSDAAMLAAIPNNTAFGNWLLNCEAVTTADIQCRLLQQLTRSDTDALIVRMMVVPAGDGTHILLAQTPIGVYLPGGAVYRFAEKDEIEQRTMMWQRCIGNLCEAASQIDADELILFDENDTLLFGYRADAQSEPIVVGVDISQFGEAVKALELSAK